MKREDQREFGELGSTAVIAVEPHVEPPGSRSGKSVLMDKAYQDFCTRRGTGEILDPDEYCAQYPSLKSSLHRLIEAHLFLEENPFLIAEPAPSRWPEASEGFMGFHLVQELGRGTFARVFLAKEHRLGDRLAVIKIAQHGGAEARIMGRIDHPNVVPVLSVQEDVNTGMTVVCMPYLGDATLCDVLDNIDAKVVAEYPASTILDSITEAASAGQMETQAQPRLAARVLRRGSYVDGIRFIGAQLADALAHIHARGIFHRDLKPSNVLMSPEGVPMLLDFNLSADVMLTTTRIGGTFPYMPPEQLQPLVEQGCFDPSSLEGRSDLFSLGVILYQLLTGSHPFGPLPLKSASQDLCRRLLDRQRHGAVHVSDLNPQVDRAFGDVIQRCLAFAPDDRPTSAAEVVRVLRQGLTPLGRARRWVARHSRTVLLAGLLLAALGGSAAVVAYHRPSFGERQMQTAFVHYKEGRYQEALDLFSTALSTDAKNASTWFARARTHQQLGASNSEHYRLAIDDYLKADELAGSAVEKGRNLAAIGYCHSLLGEDKLAMASYEDAIKVAYVSAEVHNNLAFSQMVRHQKYEQVPLNLQQALRLDPGLLAAYHNRALFALEKARWTAGYLDGKKDPRSINQDQDASAATLHQLREEIVQHLNAGMADIEMALKLARPTAELHYDAACIYGCAAARLDAKWTDRALEQLAAAVKQGIHRKLAEEAFFHSLRNDPRFQALLATPPAAEPMPATQRVVDPIRNFPG